MKQKILLMFLVLAMPVAALHAQTLFSQNEDVIPPELDHVYTKAMQYLVKTQQADGTWSSQYGGEPGVVGLCILSILAHGEDPNSGPYRITVQRGIDFILKSQNEKTGYIGQSMYNHGFATLALAECYGAVQNPRLGPALQKAVDLIISVQSRNPFNAWRYSPESPDADTTVSGAQMVALFAVRNAGIGVPDEAINKGLKFFVNCQSADGGIGYVSAGGPDAARTAIGLLVFGLAKQQKSVAYRSSLRYLKDSNSGSGDGYYQYYLYYAAQALFRAGPGAFDSWNAANIKLLSSSQADNGSWTGQFGPTFSTAASLLSLALNYRLLPIYER